MLKKIFKKKEEKTISEPSTQSAYPVALSGSDLISVSHRQAVILKIKRLFSITEDVWNDHYLFAIEEFAEIVQGVPASEFHHHSTEGGLIDHTLEALHAGVRISQGFILPPNAEPEHIAAAADKWRFGAFIAILAHDIGKIITDIEIVHRAPGESFQKWHPWFGNIPVGHEYTYRYKDRVKDSRAGKTLHEKASMSVLPRLLTKEAAEWIFEDIELLSQIFSTVTHSTFGGQSIAEIVRTADSSSVGQNLGADTGVSTSHSNVIPLHEKIIVSLRKLIVDGDLKRNKPGAALWVTEKDTWVVSRPGIEAVQAQLGMEGHKGIPKNPVRIFDTLLEHELLIKNLEGGSVWTAEINDYSREWKQKLTFLRFPNDIIWPTSHPELFDGDVIPVTQSGKRIEEDVSDTDIAVESVQEEQSHKSQIEEIVVKDNSSSTLEVKPEIRPKKAKFKSSEPNKVNAGKIEFKNVEPDKVDGERKSSKSDQSEEESGDWFNSRDVEKSDFIAWLRRDIANGKIKTNGKKAPVHFTEDYVVLITPLIFRSYMKSGMSFLKSQEYKEGGNPIHKLQRELQALQINKKSIKGENIIKVKIDGPREKPEISTYLLDRKSFPTLKHMPVNNVIKVLDA